MAFSMVCIIAAFAVGTQAIVRTFEKPWTAGLGEFLHRSIRLRPLHVDSSRPTFMIALAVEHDRNVSASCE